MNRSILRAVQLTVCVLVMGSIAANGSNVQGKNSGAVPIAWNRWIRMPNLNPLRPKYTTDQVHLAAHADSNGRKGKFDVTVTCDQKRLILEVEYTSFVSGDLKYMVADSFARTGIEMKIDGRERLFGSLLGSSDHRYALIPLTDMPADRVRTTMGYREPVRQEILRAQTVTMQFSLNNGDTPILTIHPQDKVFRDYVSQEACRDPNPIEPIDPKQEALEEKEKQEIKKAEYWNDIQDGKAPAAHVIVGKPPDARLSDGWVLLDERDVGTMLLGQGVDVPENEDPVHYVRDICHSSVSECKKYFLGGQAANRLKTSGETKLRGVPPGTYHLIVVALESQRGYFEDQVVNIKVGQNTISFPVLH